jgi:hypothetical protein
MAVVELARTNGHDLSDAEARAAAEDMWRRSAAAGETLTGGDLGRAFGKTDRWGRKRIERARAHTAADVPATAAGGTFPDGAGQALVPRNDKPAVTTSPGTAVEAVAEDGTSVAAAPSERFVPAAAASGSSLWDRLAVIAVGLIAAGASYGHMYKVALMAGEHSWIAKAFPLTVDGLGFIALRRGRDGRGWLVLAIAVSVIANVAAAEPTIVGRLVAAWPPLSLLGCHRLLHARKTDRSGS